jgi:cytochrome c biogenesis protein CcdA
MITRRTLLIYNFGIALIFVAIGVLSLLVLDPFTNRSAIVPPFDPASHAAIQEEKDVEHLRSRATFYFELGRELKRARYSDSNSLFSEFRYFCFLLGAIFALGGTMCLLATKPVRPS